MNPQPKKTLNPEYGRIPPQAIDIEEGILGAIMLERDAIEVAMKILKPESFYKEAHQKIFSSVLDLHSKKEPIDLLTVTESLKKLELLNEVGGASYITQLTVRIASAAHLEYHCRIVAQKFIQRELIRVSSEITSKSYDESTDVDELIEYAESEIKNVIESNTENDTHGETLYFISKTSISNAKVRKSNRDNNIMPGVNTGIGALQEITGGWQPADLIYIGGRPSMGKTAFAIFEAKQSAKKESKTVFFSLEMNDISIADRAVLGETDINPEKWRNGDLTNFEFSQFEESQKIIRHWPLIIYDKGINRPSQIHRICKKEKPDIIFIDYLQLMNDDSGTKHQNRNSEVESISRKLKAIAKEFNMPVICLSQLNRGLDIRGSKVPVLSDLRDSGAIEQDADLVIFPFRPYVYDQSEPNDLMQIHIAKHRNGRLGSVNMKHNQYINNFFDDSKDFEEVRFNTPNTEF